MGPRVRIQCQSLAEPLGVSRHRLEAQSPGTHTVPYPAAQVLPEQSPGPPGGPELGSRAWLRAPPPSLRVRASLITVQGHTLHSTRWRLALGPPEPLEGDVWLDNPPDTFVTSTEGETVTPDLTNYCISNCKRPLVIITASLGISRWTVPTARHNPTQDR